MDPAAVRRSYADAEPRPFWLAQSGAPDPGDPVEGNVDADLVVIGGGLTGLWAALLAKEENPGRDVVLLEGERIAFGATGRNGGFMDASLTHGIENGVARWPGEMPQLERLGRENFDAIKDAMARHGIDAGFEETGELAFATEPHQTEWIPEAVALAKELASRPQAALRNDRLSSYEQWSMSLDDALMREYEHGMATLRTGELLEGLEDYASGGWRAGPA